jgi:3-isopropylmalate/(R)-2-methylmalate dehydratase small subunit
VSTCVDRLEGPGLPLRGDNIDTDRIIPARFLKAVTFDGLGDHVFEDDREALADHPFSNPAYQQAQVLFTNDNFGSGSSREHAPQALKRWGISACVGESFSEIFRGNSLAIGLPCVTVSHEDIERLMSVVEATPSARFTLVLSDRTLTVDGTSVSVGIEDSVRDAFLTGTWDATGMLLDDFDVVRGVASRVPYIRGF